MEEIGAVNIARPDYIGFVFVPSSKRFVTAGQAAVLRGQLADGIKSVGVFVNKPKEKILALVNQQVIDIIQLHGSEDEEYIRQLKCLTAVPVMKAVSMQSSNDPVRWEDCQADYLLLDHGSGGTGTCFDHSLIGDIRKPFFLAGGLTPENVVKAAELTAPYAVDLSSGVEQNGIKDAAKIAETVRRIRHV